MPRARPPERDEPDLLTLLAEQESGPQPCPHVFAVGKNGYGWEHERDPNSPYYMEWVDANPNCRRSALPGRKQAFI